MAFNQLDQRIDERLGSILRGSEGRKIGDPDFDGIQPGQAIRLVRPRLSSRLFFGNRKLHPSIHPRAGFLPGS